MYFGTKSYLKSTRNHTVKHTLKVMINLLQNFMLRLILTGPNNLYWDLPNILFGLCKQDHKGSYLSEKSNLS